VSLYSSLIFPLLKRLDAENSHNLAVGYLRLMQSNAPGKAILSSMRGRVQERPVELFGLRFPNEIGVAAGLDKNAQIVPALALLGFGHIEVGTITPRPQVGNPRPRVFRVADRVLLNRMGFPNCGAVIAAERLTRVRQANPRAIIGVSIGKQKETDLVGAARDYVEVMEAVFPYCDYMAVNISSPNTPGLRELQSTKHVNSLLAALVHRNGELSSRYGEVRRPLLVKIAPDMSIPEIETVVAASIENGIDGIIATNTTTRRAGLSAKWAGQAGGISGQPLADISNEIIGFIADKSAGRLPIVGVGGVFDGIDVQRKLDAGASLVQIYTGIIFEGPAIAGNIVRQLSLARASR